MWGTSAAAKALLPNIIKVPENALKCNVCVFMHAHSYCLQKHLSVLQICSTRQYLREGPRTARQDVLKGVAHLHASAWQPSAKAQDDGKADRLQKLFNWCF